MSKKTDQLEQELSKARENVTKWSERVKTLELKLREAENAEIHEMVHAANVTPEQLAKLLETLKTGVPQPESIPAFVQSHEETSATGYEETETYEKHTW